MAMKRAILFCLSLALLLTTAAAQRPGRFSPEEFRAKQESYITKAAKLTKAEADKFFPIYREMKDKQRQYASQAQALKRNHPASGATDKDYSATVSKIAELEAEAARIQVEYYKKLCKAVSAKKVYAAILADDDFNRRLMQHFDGGRQQKPRK